MCAVVRKRKFPEHDWLREAPSKRSPGKRSDTWDLVRSHPRISLRSCGLLASTRQPYGSGSFQNLVKRAVGTVSPVDGNVRKCSKNKQTEAGCSNPVLPSSIEFYRSFKSIGWPSNEGEHLRCNAAFARLRVASSVGHQEQ
jgi:hypothetical protein